MAHHRYAALRAFLAHPNRADTTLSYHELQGFLFTVANAPEIVMPSDWLKEVFNGNEPVYESEAQLQSILGQFMQLYNEVNDASLRQPAALPDDCPVHADAMANFDEAPLAQWSRGFISGHEWLEELWDLELPEDLDLELGSSMFALSFFGSRRIGDAYLEESDEQKSIEEIAETVRSLIPDALTCYATLGRAIADAEREVDAEAEARRRAPKVGRNAPCPCGSGRKFKKCCGGKRH